MMNIKEYVKIQADICQNDVMKGIFVTLVDKFYPKPKPQAETKLLEWKPANKTANDNFSKRKVRINKMPNGKPCIGLVDVDEMGIKIPNGYLTFVLVDEFKNTYYYGKEHLFVRKENSRMVYMIDKNNYEEHRANVETVKDYVLYADEILRIE